MKILFPLHGLVRWNGGVDLVRLLESALRAAECSREFELQFAIPVPSSPTHNLDQVLRSVRKRRARVCNANGDRGDPDALLQSAMSIVAQHSVTRVPDSAVGIAEAARSLNSDIVFPTMTPLPVGTPPAVGYVFDFQHKYLPHHFKPWTRWNRDRHFAALARGTAGLVVNSRNAKADAVHFLNVRPERVLAMPFTPYATEAWFTVQSAEAQQRYGLNSAYVIICNHFWMHKDHATAFRAFALARSGLPSATRLVLTGDPIDHRNPGYYAALQNLARKLKIDDKIIWLGLIPKSDQIALLKGALMLWQPTRFEGGPGGGSVYEAIGLGVPAVVSDLQINRELDQGIFTLFETGNPEALAEAALGMIKNAHARPSINTLRQQATRNLGRMGMAITEFLLQLTAESR